MRTGLSVERILWIAGLGGLNETADLNGRFAFA